ncbi:hypothetical protein [Streptomyces sp. NPDC001165]|uniref:hypothetical protein n=1 Tax=Streptomyces sp. NPDC001165 TaxID=3364546 RepID=UPI0036C8C1EF
MTTHLVCLQFVAGGPMVTGEWADGATARRTWRDWVGLYGSDEKVVIRLAENADGGERVLMAWKRGHAVEASSDGPVRQTARDSGELVVQPSNRLVAAK